MSDLSIASVRGFRPGQVRAVASRLEVQRGRIVSALASVIAGSARGAGVWSGPAADAARIRRGVLVEELALVARQVGLAVPVLHGLADRMESSLSVLVRAEQVAADGGAAIGYDGGITVRPRVPTGDPLTDVSAARQEAVLRADVLELLSQAERLARDADQEVAARLVGLARSATAQPPGWGGTLSLPSPPVLPVGGAVGPDAIAASSAWWRSLTRDERGRVIREHPEWVGPRDGVPARDRHAANLVLLVRAKAGVAAEYRKATEDAAFGLIPILDERRRSLEAIDAVLARQDGVVRQLLLVDASHGLVRVAVSVGDVDRADHVATFVGGLTTRPDTDLLRYDSIFAGLRGEAMALADSTSSTDIAIVTWMGYPAPQLVDTPMIGGRSVLSADVARAHAAELAAFAAGIDASRDVRAHQTLLAHSYGTVLGGLALQRNSAFDDAVLFGSPGTVLTSIAETGLKRDGLNVLVAHPDPVAVTQWHGPHPELATGATILATGAAVKPGSALNLRPSKGHSGYLEDGSTGRYNIAAVLAGRPDLRIRPEP